MVSCAVRAFPKEFVEESNINYYPIVMISGFFDPLQPGHIDLFKYAKSGVWINYRTQPYVIAVIHSAEDIAKKAGFYVYDFQELKAILLGFNSCIDEVQLAVDMDGLVAKSIMKIRPNYFVKGPDRNIYNMPELEIRACDEVGCEVIFQKGAKIGNSSDIKARIRKQLGVLKA